MTDQNLNNASEPDGSESRFNRVIKPNPSDQPPNSITRENGIEKKPITSNPAQPVQVHDPVASFTTQSPQKRKPSQNKKHKARPWVWILLLLVVFFVFFTPIRVTTLVLGIDWRPAQNPWLGRSDTMILTTLRPVSPQISMLSIPRDLWVPIPNNGVNRINTAHYFAELDKPGTGKEAARQVVEQDFGIKVDYVVRLKFTGFVDMVDALGGVTVDLPKDMSGLSAGKHHLNGTEALKFVRDREGSDDFFRQQRGQLFISAAFKEMLNPLKWIRIPAVMVAASKAVDTDLPFWLWPRVGFGFAFSAIKGFDAHTFDRNSITPWVTDQGAQVLLPNWDLMNPLIDGLFK
jgi:LCP family protein required for cell wall assembly